MIQSLVRKKLNPCRRKPWKQQHRRKVVYPRSWGGRGELRELRADPFGLEAAYRWPWLPSIASVPFLLLPSILGIDLWGGYKDTRRARGRIGECLR